MSFLKVKNRAFSTLASGVDDITTSWTLATGEGAKFPTTGDFHITCEDEIVKCTSRSTDVLTVVRAQEGTAAAAHTAGKAVELRVTAGVIDQIETELTTHKGLSLSASVHPNTAMASMYLAAAQLYIPSAKYARVQLDTATFDPGSNFKNGYVFNQEQADADNCSATNIRDTSVNFQTITGQTNGLRYALVTWSSDAGGTLNLGSGYVTAVPDTTNLTIYKTNGVDFANSYYYTIKEAWYKVPVTGYYTLKWFTRFSSTNMVADKSYYIIAFKNSGSTAMGCLHSSRAAALQPFAAAILSLTANDLVSTGVYHDAGVDTIRLENYVHMTALHIALLQEA